MEISVGRQFYSSAFEPIQKYCGLMARKDIVAALAVVQYHHLTESFYRGVDAVARETRTSRDAVLQVLPMTEVYGAAEASAQNQQRAVEVFNQHEGDLGHLVVGSAGLLVDTFLGGFGLGNLLASKAGDFLRNTRLDGPCKDLVAALQAYDDVLKRCVTSLDANRSLGTAAVGGTSRTLLWAVVALAVAAGGAVATAIWARSSNATTNAGMPPAAVSVSIVTPEPPPAPTPPSPHEAVSPAAVTKSHPAQRPAASAPVSRTACLQACVAKCNDDASCERSCAATCPH